MEKLLEELLLQENQLQFDHFNNDDAIGLGLIALRIATDENLPVTIDITRFSQKLFHVALPGTSTDNDCWIERKIKLVNRIGHSSFYIGRFLASNNKTLEDVYELSHYDYAPHGGCFPIILKDTGIIGTFTISGLEQSEDHALAIRCIREYLTNK